MEHPELDHYKVNQAEQNNELGRKILALYQQIDLLRDEVAYWKQKYEQERLKNAH